MNSPQESYTEKLSKPQMHNAAEFRYLIHGVLNPGQRIDQIMGFAQLAQSQMEDGENVELQSIDLLREPQRIAEKTFISCSLIDQDHTETWAPAGYILKTPPFNVLDAAPHDLGTNLVNPAHVRRKARESTLRTADDILGLTTSTQYNEVLLEGETDGGKVEIVGVYQKIYDDGELVDEHMSEKIQNVARRYGYPLITIIQKESGEPDYAPRLRCDEYVDYKIAVRDHSITYSFGRSHEDEEEDGSFYWVISRSGNKQEKATRKQFETGLELMKSSEQSHEPTFAEALAAIESRYDEFEYKMQHPITTIIRESDTGEAVGFRLVRYDNEYFVDLKSGYFRFQPQYQKRMQAIFTDMHDFASHRFYEDKNTMRAHHLQALETLVEIDKRLESSEQQTLLELINTAKEKVPADIKVSSYDIAGFLEQFKHIKDGV